MKMTLSWSYWPYYSYVSYKFYMKHMTLYIIRAIWVINYVVYFMISQKKIMGLKVIFSLVSCQNSNFLRNFSKIYFFMRWVSKLNWEDLNVFSDASHSLRSAIWYGWISITDFERMHLTLNDSDFIIFISRRCRNYKGPETILDIQSNKQVLVPYTLTDSFPNRKSPYDWNRKVK